MSADDNRIAKEFEGTSLQNLVGENPATVEMAIDNRYASGNVKMAWQVERVIAFEVSMVEEAVYVHDNASVTASEVAWGRGGSGRIHRYWQRYE